MFPNQPPLVSERSNFNDYMRDYDPDTNLNPSYQSIHVCNYYDPWNLPKDLNKDNTISLLHVNARSLSSNFDDLYNLTNSFNHEFEFIAITETWLPSHVPTSMFGLNGYTLEHTGRNNRRGGGVGIYVKSNFTYKILNDLSVFVDGCLESLFIEVLGDLVIGVVYCPPSGDSD